MNDRTGYSFPLSRNRTFTKHAKFDLANFETRSLTDNQFIMPALSNYLLKELSQLHCIDHRTPANVYINDEGFITYTTCCDVLHQSLSDAQDYLRSQFRHLSSEEQDSYMPVS